MQSQYKNYLVAYMDVLGQGEELKKLQKCQHPVEGDKEFQKLLNEVHTKTASFIYEMLRPSFENFFNEYKKESVPSIKIPNDKLEDYKKIRKVRVLKMHSFSDCIQAYVPIKQEGVHSNVLNSIFGIIGACGEMFLITLSCGRVLRAGIEIGWGTELENGEIYGQVLHRAYQLESKIAQYPRIVVGKEFINYLLNLINKNPQIPNQEESDTEYCKRIADIILKMIIKDYDGNLILDYMGKTFKDNYFHSRDKGLSYEDLVKRAKQYIEEEYVKRKESKEEKDKILALRYYLLVNYFRDSLLRSRSAMEE